MDAVEWVEVEEVLWDVMGNAAELVVEQALVDDYFEGKYISRLSQLRIAF